MNISMWYPLIITHWCLGSTSAVFVKMFLLRLKVYVFVVVSFATFSKSEHLLLYLVPNTCMHGAAFSALL